MAGLAALTGVSGFVGGHVAAALAARGWRLRVLLRRWWEPPAALAGTSLGAVPGDLSDAAALARLVAGADAVVHMAGVVRSVDPAAYAAINAAGSARLAEAVASHAPGARTVLMSSMAARMPALSPYAASKRAGEEALAARLPGAAILRPAAVYGPGDRETLAIFRLMDAPVQPLLNGPAARVCLVHARDLAAAVVAALAPGAPAGVHEVTDARTDGYRWTEIAGVAARALGRPPRPLRLPAAVLRATGRLADALGHLPGGAALAARAGLAGSAKIAELMHPDWSSDPARQLPPALWHPGTGIEAGFAETVAAHRAAGWLR